MDQVLLSDKVDLLKAKFGTRKNYSEGKKSNFQKVVKTRTNNAKKQKPNDIEYTHYH